MKRNGPFVMIAALCAPMACSHPDDPNVGTGCEGYRIQDGFVLLFEDTVHAADPVTFRCVENEYGVDGSHVFFGHRMIPWLDATSFKVLEHGYALDKHRVLYDHYSGDSIPGADPATFEVLDLSFTKDKRSVYYWSVAEAPVRLSHAGPASFRSFGSCYRDTAHLFGVSGQVIARIDTCADDLLQMLCGQDPR